MIVKIATVVSIVSNVSKVSSLNKCLKKEKKKLSCSERHAGACGQAGCEVCGHYPARHCWL